MTCCETRCSKGQESDAGKRSTCRPVNWSPDTVVNDLIEAQLDRPEIALRGAVLDGFPRTVGQCELLCELWWPTGPELAIELDVPTTAILARLALRRWCSACGATTVVCASCGEAMVVREDDDPDTLQRRLWYHERSGRPVLDWYRRNGLLARIDGEGHPDEIADQVANATVRTWSAPRRAGVSLPLAR